MRIGTGVGHGIDGERHVKSQLVGVTGGGLYTGAGCDAGDDHLSDATLLEITLQIRVRERAPSALGHRMIAGLPIQFRDELGPSGGKRWKSGRLFRSARCTGVDVDEHYG